MQKIQQLFTAPKGSVLVFSLIVLAILLSAAITVATVSVINRRSTLTTTESNQSFQVANSGLELIMKEIYKNGSTHASLNALATALGGGATCSGSTITKTNVAGGTITVSFFDNAKAPINCTDTDWRSKVADVKSEGTFSGSTRVVETAIAAGSGSGISGGCFFQWNSPAAVPENLWGVGCDTTKHGILGGIPGGPCQYVSLPGHSCGSIQVGSGQYVSCLCVKS